MANYLVTGAAGFIASRVCELLLEAGHTVVGVDNLNDYYDVRLKLYRLGRLARLAGMSEAEVMGHGLSVDGWKNSGPITNNLKPITLKSDRFEFHTLDIEDLPALERVFTQSDFDAVFNLAARAGVRYSIEFPELYRRTNVLGAENVLKCQVKYGVKKQVLASSSSVYAGCPMPFTEDATLGTMQSPYAETKRQAELLAKDYHLKHGLDVTVLRYFTVFGPAGRPDMAPLRFIKWIDEGTPITLFGDGSAARDFTYVDDIARGTVLAGMLYGGKMREQKAETGKLKAEVSGTESGSGQKPSAFSFQPSGFPVVAPSYDVINLGGGRNPISMLTVIGFIEKALNDSRREKAESGKLKAEGSDKKSGLRSQVSGLSVNPQLSAFSSQLSASAPVRAIISGQPPSAADMKETWADIAKAKRLLGWSPQDTPEEGFRRTVAWHVANREWLKNIKA